MLLILRFMIWFMIWLTRIIKQAEDLSPWYINLCKFFYVMISKIKDYEN